MDTNFNRVRMHAPNPGHRAFSLRMAGGATVWLAVVLTLTGRMMREASRQGSIKASPTEWPVDSRIQRSTERPTLIIFAHPKCPCTRASLGELEVLLMKYHQQVSTHVVFLKPEGTTEDWTATDLWQQASAIPGVSISIDKAGAEAHRFKAETSGHTLLYDAHGHLAFSGGITVSRGHSGESPGSREIVNQLKRWTLDTATSPVFGCPLFENDCSRQGNDSKP